MSDQTKLPPGQYALDRLPRFGLSRFANRFPNQTQLIRLQVTGDVAESITVSGELAELSRIDETADLHCVTTWTCRSLRWSGFRFRDFFDRIVVPRARPVPEATRVIFRCQDGYAAKLLLADLMVDTVVLADRLNGAPLTVAHGAPMRLVAPAHYGYKNPKHVCAVEFVHEGRHYRPSSPFRFMDHPRARVALEERGTGVPGWLLRCVYRPLVRPGIWLFRRALDRHERVASRTGA